MPYLRRQGYAVISLFRRVIRNEAAVKSIFDHYKNFGVAALIIAVGVRVYNGSETGIFWWGSLVSGAAITFVGVLLLILNERHGMYLLNKASLRFVEHLLIIIVYGLSTIVLAGNLIFASFVKGS